MTLTAIARKVERGERLSPAEGLVLLREADLSLLRTLASLVRYRKHPAPEVTYVVGRNLSYTNVCWVQCTFCAFYRLPGEEGAWTLTREEILGKVQELTALGGTEVLFQGGLNPALKIGWYEETFAAIKAAFPVHLHALSPAELLYLAKISGLSLAATLERLKRAGLDSIPGGGAEILVDAVRQEISPLKDTAEEWLACMRTAHHLGIPSSATMMYGSVETPEQRVEHLCRIRAIQDETGGFTAFIAWNYQPDHTVLGGARTDGIDHLRTVAVARLMLDNIPSLQASWVTQGPEIARTSLFYGVNDFGSTVLEEKVVSAAGATWLLSLDEILASIRSAGFTPRRRNTRYERLE
ncbi:MAG: cyclic dehypoxanthinyl futalosine synthase [candidate division NC10 bacterium]